MINTTHTNTQPRRILVTAALPYANGPLHLGHLLENIQIDIWARFQRMRGHECYLIGGADAHGTPIMINAEKQGISPEALIEMHQIGHHKTFDAFLIHYDSYYTTHSDENRELASLIYDRLKANGDIVRHVIQQKFDPVKNMFLPDRFVKGNCPRCDAADQYGDNCEKCGATYTPADLKNPFSVLSGAAPIEKETEHLFFDLPRYTNFLRNWISEGHHLQDNMMNKLQEWFETGLQAWDISRDAPYFGFEIPGEVNKYFYVWLDAPIGYMASFKHYCATHPEINFDDFWNTNSNTELYHFIGKDIVYFHALFWPAMLSGAQFRTPTSIFTHGFVTVEGEKMSKSRGTFINADQYLEHLDPEYLRYYFAAKLSGGIEDVDLHWEDFRQRINADLVGKVVNIASRSAKFIQQYFNNKLSEIFINPELQQQFLAEKNTIADAYETRDYAKAVRIIMGLADLANQYIDAEKPWSLVKTDGPTEKVHAVCSMGLNLFRLLIAYLKPVLPQLAEKSEAFLAISPLTWNYLDTPLLDHAIAEFQPLMTRVDADKIQVMLKHA